MPTTSRTLVPVSTWPATVPLASYGADITASTATTWLRGMSRAIMRDGRFVQVGTPQEVVTEPADDYVRNFVRDIPRSHVVAVDAVMSAPHEANGTVAGQVLTGTKVRDVVWRADLHEPAVAHDRDAVAEP